MTRWGCAKPVAARDEEEGLMSTEFDREGLVNIFLTEAEDSLVKLWSALHPSDNGMPTRDAINEQYIVAHTLKGTSSLYGYTGLSGLTNVLETRVENIRDLAEEQWPHTVTMLRDLVGTIRVQVQHIKEYGSEVPT